MQRRRFQAEGGELARQPLGARFRPHEHEYGRRWLRVFVREGEGNDLRNEILFLIGDRVWNERLLGINRCQTR